MTTLDRDFWLTYARNNVIESIENRNKAAKAIDTFLLWIWLIYTSIFALGSFFDQLSSDLTHLITVAQPIFFIMLARWFCLWVQMPTSIKADPQVMEEIMDGYIEIVKSKKNRLKLALGSSLFAILSLTFALISFSHFDPNRRISTDIEQLELSRSLREGEFDLLLQERKNELLKEKNYDSLGKLVDVK